MMKMKKRTKTITPNKDKMQYNPKLKESKSCVFTPEIANTESVNSSSCKDTFLNIS